MKIETTGTISLNGKLTFKETTTRKGQGTEIVNETKGQIYDKEYVNNPKTLDYANDDNETETKELVFENIVLDIKGITEANPEGAELIKAVYEIVSKAFSGIFAKLNAK